MVNSDMFRNAIPMNDVRRSVNSLTNPQNVNTSPPMASNPQKLDPEMENWRMLVFKVLLMGVGGLVGILLLRSLILKLL